MVSDSPAGEALPMGTFVAADIAGIHVQNTVRVPRSALRANNQLMVIDEKNKLEMRRVEILRAAAKWAYIDHGVVAGERICLTTIESPLSGMVVRIDGESGADDATPQLAGAESN